MAFNEKLNKLLEEIHKKKLCNYDNVFIENNELKKKNILLQVKLKALLVKEKDAKLWWDVVQDIVKKDIGKVCKKYERNERFYRQRISQMEKVMPSFEYEPLILSLEPKTSNVERDKRDTNGVGPSGTRVEEEP